jgi:parallel beta-helix repeat protein
MKKFLLAAMLGSIIVSGLAAVEAAAAIDWYERIINEDFRGAQDIYADDLNQDGLVDIIGAAYNLYNITWWRNRGDNQFAMRHITTNFYGANSVYPVDLDGDGDLDVLATSYSSGEIAWWRNNGSPNLIKHSIDNNFPGARDCFAADLDGDGDMDVLGAALDAHEIAWWEYVGNFNVVKHVIDDHFIGARAVYAADLDGDGDADVLGAGYNNDEIAWWENNSHGDFIKHVISDDFLEASDVCAADLDTDGDMDIIGAALDSDEIAWWENTEAGFVKHSIDDEFDGAVKVHAADINGDGYLDVVGAGNKADEIAWWKNDGNQNFVKQVIAENFGAPLSVFAADIDGDGDTDVVSVSNRSALVAYFENRPGQQQGPIIDNITITPPYPVSGQIVEVSAKISDLDGRVEFADLYYRVDQNAYSLSMKNVTDSFYASIPGQADGTVVKYLIVAVDNSGYVTVTDSLCYTVHDHILVNVPQDYLLIQTAIDASNHGDTILVHPGTYHERINYNGKNLIVGSLYLTTGDTSYISSTILDGDSSGTILTFTSGEDSPAAVIGFTIQNGYANQSGGGIYCHYSHPTIRNNIFRYNSAQSGGAITCDFSHPNIIENEFRHNRALNSGMGIFLWYSDVRITGNQFIENSGNGRGGGIYCSRSYATIVDNIIRNNTCNDAGGLYCEGANPYISGNLICDNEAVRYGGGIVCSGATIVDNIIENNRAGDNGGGIRSERYDRIYSNIIRGNSGGKGGGINCCSIAFSLIDGNTISGNTADSVGGGICIMDNACPRITDNMIFSNSVQRETGTGGGICCQERSYPVISGNMIAGNSAGDDGGGLNCRDDSNPIIVDNTICNNTAAGGGGISCSDNSTAIINHNLIRDNTASLDAGGGIKCNLALPDIAGNTITGNDAVTAGGIHILNSSPTIKNSIIRENSDVQIYGDPLVTYCNIEGGWAGTGNIDADPLFVDPGHGFYQLNWSSPCIDAGDPNSPPDPDGTIADMGAYYFHQGEIIVDMTPLDAPISVPAGGHFNFNGLLKNNTGQQQTTDVWVMLDVPGIGNFGPIEQYSNIPLSANQGILISDIRQDVPGFAPIGFYTFLAYCGDYPDDMIDSCFFGFEVTVANNGSANKWDISGWFEESDDLVDQLPAEFAMSPNYPNPFNPTTTINYQLPVNREVTLIIYNLLGQKVETLVDGHVKAGCHSITWDASRFASGIYFYRLTARQGPGLSTAGDQVITRRMTLLK